MSKEVYPKAQIVNYQQRISQLQKDLNNREELINQTRSALEESQNKQRILIDKINKRPELIQTEEDIYQDHILQQESTIQSLQEMVNSLREKNSLLKQNSLRHRPITEKELMTKSEPVQRSITDLMQAEQTIIEMEEKNAKLEKIIENSKEKNSKLQLENLQLNQQIANLTKIINQRDQTINDLQSNESDFQSLNSTIFSLKQQLEKKDDQIAAIQSRSLSAPQTPSKSERDLDEQLDATDESNLNEIVSYLSQKVGRNIDPELLSASDKIQVARDLIVEDKALSARDAQSDQSGKSSGRLPYHKSVKKRAEDEFDEELNQENEEEDLSEQKLSGRNQDDDEDLENEEYPKKPSSSYQKKVSLIKKKYSRATHDNDPSKKKHFRPSSGRSSYNSHHRDYRLSRDVDPDQLLKIGSDMSKIQKEVRKAKRDYWYIMASQK